MQFTTLLFLSVTAFLPFLASAAPLPLSSLDHAARNEREVARNIFGATPFQQAAKALHRGGNRPRSDDDSVERREVARNLFSATAFQHALAAQALHRGGNRPRSDDGADQPSIEDLDVVRE